MWFTKKKKKTSAKLLSASCTEAHIKEARTEGTAVSKERSDNPSRMHGQQDAWPAFWRMEERKMGRVHQQC